MGTIGATVKPDGSVFAGVISTEGTASNSSWGIDSKALSPVALASLDSVSLNGQPQTVRLQDAGSYRMRSTETAAGATVLVGIPTKSVDNAIQRLVLVEVVLSVVCIAVAGIASAGMVSGALLPLRRVAVTAGRVSALPLERGDVDLAERVPESQADPRTEVGQMGAALNRMLDHVGAALTARQVSEMRVRQFVADASHELRTPLSSIRGYAEMAGRFTLEDQPELHQALNRIQSEGRRMGELVDELLLLARLDAGRPLDSSEVDLSLLVMDCVNDARAAGPNHNWHLDLPEEPIAVFGDNARLRQVLGNLLTNACVHTPPATTVTTRLSSEGAEVILEVIDDGPGISSDLMPRAFGRFVRGDASRARNAGSTGLGLAIVKAVTTAHRGHVHVESTPGRTTFRIQLPARSHGEAIATN